MNAHDMFPSDSEPTTFCKQCSQYPSDCMCSDPETDACQCSDCSRPRTHSCGCPSNDMCMYTLNVKGPTPFSITGPGEYLTRDGRKVIIGGKANDLWVGTMQQHKNWAIREVPFAWHNDGANYARHPERTSDCDIISKYIEPRKPIKNKLLFIQIKTVVLSGVQNQKLKNMQ